MIWDELLALSLPISMIIFGRESISLESISAAFIVWLFILFSAGFIHHHVFCFRGHEGIEIEQKSEKLDFGIYQLAATFDRKNFKHRGTYLFSDHTLHHMFPTLDNAVLPHLHKELYETCKDFEQEIRDLSFWDESFEKTFKY